MAKDPPYLQQTDADILSPFPYPLNQPNTQTNYRAMFVAVR